MTGFVNLTRQADDGPPYITYQPQLASLCTLPTELQLSLKIFFVCKMHTLASNDTSMYLKVLQLELFSQSRLRPHADNL